MRVLEGHDGPVYGVTFTADGAALASAGKDGTVRLWQLGSPAPPRLFHPAGPVSRPPAQALAAHPTQPVIAAGTTAGLVLWNTNANTARRLPKPPDASVTSVAYCDRGRYLAVGFGDRLQPEAPGRLGLYADSGTPANAVNGSAGVLAVAANTGDKRIVWGGGDRRITRWDLTSLDQPMSLRQGREVRAIALRPDGNAFAAADDYTIRVYHAGSMQQLRQLTGHQGRVDALAFTPDGRLLVSGAWDGTVRFWDPETGRQLAAHDWDLGNVRTVAVSPDGLLAAAAGDRGTIVIWDVDL